MVISNCRLVTLLVIVLIAATGRCSENNPVLYIVRGETPSNEITSNEVATITKHYSDKEGSLEVGKFFCVKLPDGIVIVDTYSTPLFALKSLRSEFELIGARIRESGVNRDGAISISENSPFALYLSQMFKSDNPASFSRVELFPQLQLSMTDPSGEHCNVSTKQGSAIRLSDSKGNSDIATMQSAPFAIAFESKKISIDIKGSPLAPQTGTLAALQSYWLIYDTWKALYQSSLDSLIPLLFQHSGLELPLNLYDIVGRSTPIDSEQWTNWIMQNTYPFAGSSKFSIKGSLITNAKPILVIHAELKTKDGKVKNIGIGIGR